MSKMNKVGMALLILSLLTISFPGDTILFSLVIWFFGTLYYVN